MMMNKINNVEAFSQDDHDCVVASPVYRHGNKRTIHNHPSLILTNG